MPSSTDARAHAKKVVLLVGLPGCGKSTQARLLHDRLGAQVIHLVKSGGELMLERDFVTEPHAAWSGSHEPDPDSVAEAPLAAAADAAAEMVVLDGFPRTVPQAAAAAAAAASFGWNLCAVELRIGEDLSLLRQSARAAACRPAVSGAASGQTPSDQEEVFLRKMSRARRKDMPAVDELRRRGVRVITFDGALHQQALFSLLVRALS